SWGRTSSASPVSCGSEGPRRRRSGGLLRASVGSVLASRRVEQLRRVSKVISLETAIREHVPDGAAVVLGTALEALIPFAAAHEIIRQRRRDLTLIGPISDICFDQLIAAGCARRVVASWVGNVQHGSGYGFRRAVEAGVPGPLEVEDHSNLTIALGLEAAGLGIPYLPTKSLLG